MVDRLLEGGFDDLGGHARGVVFWQEVWKAVRLEERLVQVDDLPDFAVSGRTGRGQAGRHAAERPQRFSVSSEFRRARKLQSTPCLCCIRAAICKCRIFS